MLPSKSTLVAIVLALLAASGCSKKEEPQAEAPPPVQITVATQDTIRRTVIADGALFPLNQSSVTPKITAPVQKFYVNRGDHVREGQLLATLENRDLTAALAESKGALDQAESNFRATQGATVPEAVVKAQADLDAARQALDAAKKVLDSREKLLQQGALAGRQVEEARVSYAQANSQFISAQEHVRTVQAVSKDEQIRAAAAQVESARSHYQSLEAQLSYSRVVSPIAGIVADRPLWAGETATAGTPLLTVMDISRVVARVNIPQNQASIVKVGQPAIVRQSDSGLDVPGKVIVVSPATDANTTTVQVWVEVANPGERLKPGASVHVTVVAETIKNATVVPATAILPGEEGGTAVLTVGADSTAHKKNVEVGIREGDKVQIVNGVRPGEEVVVVGGLGIDDKAKVRIIDTSVQEADEEDQADEPAADKTKGGKDQKKDEAKPKAK